MSCSKRLLKTITARRLRSCLVRHPFSLRRCKVTKVTKFRNPIYLNSEICTYVVWLNWRDESDTHTHTHTHKKTDSNCYDKWCILNPDITSNIKGDFDRELWTEINKTGSLWQLSWSSGLRAADQAFALQLRILCKIGPDFADAFTFLVTFKTFFSLLFT